MRFNTASAFLIAILAGGATLAQPLGRVDVGYFANGEFGGYRVQTSLIIQNQEATEATVQVRFRASDGGPMEGLTVRSRAHNGQQHQTGSNGDLEGLALPPGAFRNFESTGEGPLQIGSCSLHSTARIRAHSRVRLFNDEGSLLTEVNILPSGDFRSGGFFLGRRDPKDIGVSFTNTNVGTSAVCVFQLYESVDGPGNDLPLLEGDGVNIILGGNAQFTRMLKELFEVQYEQTLEAFLADPATGDVYATVTCDNPICAVVLRLNGLDYLGIPVYRLDPDQ